MEWDNSLCVCEAANTILMDGVCTECEDNEVADAGECTECGGNEVAVDGVCIECGDNEAAVDGVCIECTMGFPKVDGSGCVTCPFILSNNAKWVRADQIPGSEPTEPNQRYLVDGNGMAVTYWIRCEGPTAAATLIRCGESDGLQFKGTDFGWASAEAACAH